MIEGELVVIVIVHTKYLHTSYLLVPRSLGSRSTYNSNDLASNRKTTKETNESKSN